MHICESELLEIIDERDGWRTSSFSQRSLANGGKKSGKGSNSRSLTLRIVSHTVFPLPHHNQIKLSNGSGGRSDTYLKGSFPVTNWNTITPNAHKSQRLSHSLSISSSGDMYSGVPSKELERPIHITTGGMFRLSSRTEVQTSAVHTSTHFLGCAKVDDLDVP